MAVERPQWEQVRAAGPYLHLTKSDFDAALKSPSQIATLSNIESLSSRMCEEELRLRRQLRSAWSQGGRPLVESALREVYQATR